MSEDVTTHTCRKCTKPIGFKSIKGLGKHLRDVHGPRLQYPKCEYTYAESREDNLRRHISIKHSFYPPTRLTESQENSMDARVVIETLPGDASRANTNLGASTGTNLTDDNEGPLDLTAKKAAQATTIIAPTEGQQRLKSVVIKPPTTVAPTKITQTSIKATAGSASSTKKQGSSTNSSKTRSREETSSKSSKSVSSSQDKSSSPRPSKTSSS